MDNPKDPKIYCMRNHDGCPACTHDTRIHPVNTGTDTLDKVISLIENEFRGSCGDCPMLNHMEFEGECTDYLIQRITALRQQAKE
jgi:hypothetical protein